MGNEISENTQQSKDPTLIMSENIQNGPIIIPAHVFASDVFLGDGNILKVFGSRKRAFWCMPEFKWGRKYGAKDASKGKALNLLAILNVTFR